MNFWPANWNCKVEEGKTYGQAPAIVEVSNDSWSQSCETGFSKSDRCTESQEGPVTLKNIWATHLIHLNLQLPNNKFGNKDLA